MWLVCAWLVACAPAPAPAPLHLLATSATATLGSQTRLCSGTEGRVLLYGDFDSAGEFPEFLAVPEDLAGAKRLVLAQRVWNRAAGGRAAAPEIRTASVAVTGVGEAPRVRRPDLAELPGGGAVSLQVLGFPDDGRARRTLESSATLPPGAILRLGFGIREESWNAKADTVAFSVMVRDEHGAERTLLEATLDPDDPRDQKWFDRRIDLSDLAGRRVRFEFTTKRGGVGPSHSLPVWSDAVVYATPSLRDRPNVLVISLDTLRARSLGSYGYGRDTSPFFDSIASDGTLFENAITASVTTSPAHMSLFTGLYPVHHGIRIALERKLPHVVTLAERLHRVGYRTAAFTENGYLIRRHGFGEGFDQYTENRGEHLKAPGEVRRTFRQAGDWIADHRELPFFLFVHTYEVHSPYDPEAPYTDLFRDAAMPGPGSPAILESRDNYDREIRIVDDELKRLFATLEKSGLAGSTIVAILADHGEEFAEHGGLQHGATVFEEGLRVPLVFWAPGRVPAGRRLAAPVSLIDVAPTILDLLGLPIPDDLDGVSLKQLLLEDRPIEPRPLFAEARATMRWIDPARPTPWNPPYFAVRTGDAKYVVHRPGRGPAQPMARFDLARDPDESVPLPVASEEARPIEALIDRYLGNPAGAAATRKPAAGGNGVSPDLRDRLRALGYAE